jgi:hypothetical protein
LIKQPQGTHRLCQEVCQAYHPGFEGIEYIVGPIVTTKGDTSRVKLNQLDASQRPKVPAVNEFSNVLLKELSVVPPD